MFTVDGGFSQGGPATTVDVVNIGLTDLYNNSGHAVRLRSVTLVAFPAHAHIRDITAYRYGGDGLGLGVTHGNLLKYCRKQDPPYPVTDVITRRHAYSAWYIAIALTFSRPGRYYISHAKIAYTTDGHRYWQYQGLYTTIDVTAARSGTKPSFDGCL